MLFQNFLFKNFSPYYYSKREVEALACDPVTAHLAANDVVEEDCSGRLLERANRRETGFSSRGFLARK